MTFQIGQEVVFVGSPNDWPNWELSPEPDRGKIYVVRWIGVAEFWKNGITPALKVDGIVRAFKSPFDHHYDHPYCAAEWRPVVTKSIEAFRRIAEDASKYRKITVREDV